MNIIYGIWQFDSAGEADRLAGKFVSVTCAMSLQNPGFDPMA